MTSSQGGQLKEGIVSNWFSGDVVANGIKIHTYRTGGDKPPLVLSHGFTDNGLCWTRVAQALQADYDVIMPDARGHGFSEAPQEGYTTETLAADLAGLIQVLGLEKPGLIGHSMGAATTALTAANTPDLVGAAILEDPPWREDLFESTPEEREARAEEWRASIMERKAQTREEIMAFCREENPTWAEVELGPWADSKLQLSLRIFDFLGARFIPWPEIVPHITCPTLLITADPEAGAIVTPQVAQEVAGVNANIQVAHISGAGHNIRREQFDQYIQAVTEFLAGI